MDCVHTLRPWCLGALGWFGLQGLTVTDGESSAAPHERLPSVQELQLKETTSRQAQQRAHRWASRSLYPVRSQHTLASNALASRLAFVLSTNRCVGQNVDGGGMRYIKVQPRNGSGGWIDCSHWLLVIELRDYMCSAMDRISLLLQPNVFISLRSLQTPMDLAWV